MHNLDKILDDVHCKYYHYDKMKRPTISWSEDYITDYFGEYNFHNNHIIVSRVLDDSRVSENMLASVIYHESLHQQFAEHDEYFMEKARLFPNYDKLFDKLSAFVDTVHNELEVKQNYNNFTKNKKRIVYIVLPYGEDYMNAFFNRDGKILVDFNATVNFDIHDDNSDLFVFLVENANQYHIVGWCTKGKLLKRMCFVQHSILGDCDYSYQMVTDYDSIYIVPDTCCDWRIDKTDFPKGFIKLKCCCYDISDECIQPDIEYVNSYREGYMKPFFDVKVINSIPEFDNVTAEELKTIEFEGLRKVLLQNAIYEIEPTFDNLVNRAVARHDVWFLSAALDDFILVNKMEPQDIPTVYDIIRIAVLCGKTDIAREFIEKYKTELPTDDDVLNNCIDYVMEKYYNKEIDVKEEMNMSKEFTQVKSFGEVFPINASNIRTPYEHQKNAMENLNLMNESKSYSTLVVLPTGGGKTYTASMWLLKNAINKKKKILWIAHRQMLLDQAAESFQKFSFAEVIPNISSFNFRIISGSSSHDRTSDIKNSDNLIIASKDSIGRNLNRLDNWLSGEDELYLIIDEAHHSTAKTYRKVIDYVRTKVTNVKLIGLTATPFRTAESEQGLLAKIYLDGIRNGKVVHNDIGITYQIGLKELINKQILSKPIFESCFTEEHFGESMGVDTWKSIQNFDAIPEEIAEKMADSAERNKLIVETYKKNQQKYGQTIVFAVSVTHAIQLAALFKKSGIKADFIVSAVKDCITGVSIGSEENERKLEDFRAGRLQVLVNVNILTEGVDLPQTKTVFLARPTVSTTLMTQMVGRALRGEKAGGTADAYIVSFIDHWNEHIAWVNPESIFGGNNEFVENSAERLKRDLRLISISKIEEFAAILDDSIDTSSIEKISFIKRIPLGMYAFTYLEKDGMDLSHQVMIYDSTQDAYNQLMESLPILFENFGITEEYLPDDVLDEMEEYCRGAFFCGEMIPAYEREDVINILKFYAQNEEVPNFYTFEDIDRSKLDISEIARHIWDEDMGERKKAEYIDSIWNSVDDNLLRLFFGRKLYFLRQLDIECMKLSHPDIYDEPEQNVKYGKKAIEDLSLFEIGKIEPRLEKELRDNAFEKSKNKNGEYCCANCGETGKSRVVFQVDHIVSMNNGGKSVSDNLQILCRKCNGTKGDK